MYRNMDITTQRAKSGILYEQGLISLNLIRNIKLLNNRKFIIVLKACLTKIFILELLWIV